MSYVSMTWEDSPSTNTPLDAENLNNMIEGIDEAHERLDDDESELSDIVSEVETARGNYPKLAPRLNTVDYNINRLGDRVTTAEGNLTDIGARLTTAEVDISERIQTINLGTVAQWSDLDSASYCAENAEFIFIPGSNLKTGLHISQNDDAVCVMKYNNGIQTLTAYTEKTQTTIARKINSIAPTFSAGSWFSATINGEHNITTGTIPFNALKSAVQQRIINLETAMSNKEEYSEVNAIFDSDFEFLDTSIDSRLPSGNANAIYLYLDKNVRTINKTYLLDSNYFPNLTTVYVDNDELDVTITGTGNLTFKFKDEFNAGQLLYNGISRRINSLESRIAALEAAAE